MKISSFTQQSPLFLIYSCNISIQDLYSEGLKKHQVNFIQALIAITLYFEGKNKINPKSFIKDLGVSKSSISQAISGLEGLGWLQRKVDDNDARSIVLTLTPTGKSSASQLISVFHSIEKKFEKRLGKTKMKELELSLLAMKNSLNSPSDDGNQ